MNAQDAQDAPHTPHTPHTPAERCVVVGAGGQGRVVMESWRAQEPGAAFAFLDDAPGLAGKEILGVAVLGPTALLAGLACRALLGIGRNPTRLALGERLASEGVRFGTVVHPSAVVSPTASIGAGTVVLPAAVVHTGARVGAHAIVNTGAIVEHDCVLEDGASVGPGVRTGGGVILGRNAFVGLGATVRPRVTIGEGTIVGAGAVVVSDLPPFTLCYGVPARVVRPLRPDDWSRAL